MPMDEDDLLSRACRAYHRHCLRHGYDPVQPCSGRSEVDGSRVTLRNVNGTLAEYEWTGCRLVMLEEQD